MSKNKITGVFNNWYLQFGVTAVAGLALITAAYAINKPNDPSLLHAKELLNDAVSLVFKP